MKQFKLRYPSANDDRVSSGKKNEGRRVRLEAKANEIWQTDEGRETAELR